MRLELLKKSIIKIKKLSNALFPFVLYPYLFVKPAFYE